MFSLKLFSSLSPSSAFGLCPPRYAVPDRAAFSFYVCDSASGRVNYGDVDQPALGWLGPGNEDRFRLQRRMLTGRSQSTFRGLVLVWGAWGEAAPPHPAFWSVAVPVALMGPGRARVLPGVLPRPSPSAGVNFGDLCPAPLKM